MVKRQKLRKKSEQKEQEWVTRNNETCFVATKALQSILQKKRKDSL